MLLLTIKFGEGVDVQAKAGAAYKTGFKIYDFAFMDRNCIKPPSLLQADPLNAAAALLDRRQLNHKVELLFKWDII